MTTEKHRAEAREIVEGVFGKRGSSPIYATAGRLFDELQTKLASALASRDAEVSEVLAGLITHRIRDKATGEVTRHWCLIEKDGYFECNPACLAARDLYNQLQPVKEGRMAETLAQVAERMVRYCESKAAYEAKVGYVAAGLQMAGHTAQANLARKALAAIDDLNRSNTNLTLSMIMTALNELFTEEGIDVTPQR